MTTRAAQLSRRLAHRVAGSVALTGLRDVAAETGAEVWLVGGAVRDTALGRPALDVDAVCVRRMAALWRGLAARFGSRGFRFRKRGVTTWRWAFSAGSLDVVDAVRRGLDRDLARRDFTINAMAWHLVEQRLHDPCGGLRDLARGVLRLPRPGVIDADAVRALRAARFSAAFPGFTLAAGARAEARRAGRALERASVERVRDELDKLLTAADPARGLATLDDLGLADAVLPELAPLRGCAAGYRRPDVWSHTLLTLACSAEAGRRRLPGRAALDDPAAVRVLRWALLLHDVAKPDTFARRPGDGKPTFHGHELLGAQRADTLLRRLRLPKQPRHRVVRLIRLHLRPGHLADAGTSARSVRRLVTAAGADLPLLVLHAACDARGSGAPDPPRWRRLRAVCAALLAEAARERRVTAPLVDGGDVMRACAIEPGPRVGQLLAEVRDLQRDGSLATREDALAWLRGQR